MRGDGAVSPMAMSPPVRRLLLTAWTGLTAALLVLAAYLALNLYRDRLAVDADQRNQLLTQARVITTNLEHQLRATDLVLRGVVESLRDSPLLANWPADLSRRLKELDDAMPGVRTLSVIDSSGFVRASDRNELIGADISAQAYFQDAKRDGEGQRLRLSAPYLTRAGVWVINAVRVIVGPAGGFRGMMVATLDPSYCRTLLGSVLYATDMRTVLIHSDGAVFVTVPERQGEARLDPAQPGSFFHRYLEIGKSEALLMGTGATTRQNRMIALRAVDLGDIRTDKGLVIGVSRDLAAVRANWRRDALTSFLASVLIALGSIFALGYFHSRIRRYDDQVRRAEAELTLLARTDSLTGCANRRHFTEQLDMELARTRRFDDRAVLLAIDLDHFKKVNDSFGHPAGDAVLRHFTDLTRQRLRQVDLLGRLGGEEFALLLPGTDGAGAAEFAESLRRLVADNPARTDKGAVSVTVSIGIAELDQADKSANDTLARADIALYRAKAAGRNRIERQPRATCV